MKIITINGVTEYCKYCIDDIKAVENELCFECLILEGAI